MFQFSTRRLTGLALVTLLSLSLAACGGDTATPTVATTAPTATTAPAAPTATAAMGVPTATTAAGGNGGAAGSGPMQDAVANMRTLKSYHMEIATEAAGQNVSQAADVDAANNKLRITSNAGGQSIAILLIGNASWMSMDGGKTYTPNPAGAQMADSLQTFIHMWDATGSAGAEAVPSGMKDGTPATEQIDGVEAHHYIAGSNDAMGGAAGAQGTVELWLTTGASPRIRQMKTTSSAAGQQSVVTIKWTKFDEDLGITAP